MSGVATQRDGSAQEPDFFEFIRRVRAGDDQAATELVRIYEPLIRREVRMHIRDSRLRRLFESSDVCQSVLGSFFSGAALGRFDLESPDELIKLLAAMARNKVAGASRLHHRQRRDSRRTTYLAEDLALLTDRGPSPSETIGGEELIERMRAALSTEEQAIAESRRRGLSWEDIAERLGGTAGARRVQFSHAIERVSQQFGVT